MRDICFMYLSLFWDVYLYAIVCVCAMDAYILLHTTNIGYADIFIINLWWFFTIFTKLFFYNFGRNVCNSQSISLCPFSVLFHSANLSSFPLKQIPLFIVLVNCYEWVFWFKQFPKINAFCLNSIFCLGHKVPKYPIFYGHERKIPRKKESKIKNIVKVFYDMIKYMNGRWFSWIMKTQKKRYFNAEKSMIGVVHFKIIT